MIKKGFFLACFLMLMGLKSASSQDDPVAQGVLFYLPTCPHCHFVIEEVLPPLQTQYGEQMQILLVDVSHPDGQKLFRDACQIYNVPSCGSVPALFIDDTYLLGSSNIPDQLPGILERGLANGGISAPPLEGLDPLFAEAFGINGTHTVVFAEPSWTDDPVAYGLGLLVLTLLCASLVVAWLIYQRAIILPVSYENYILVGLAAFSLIIALTLLLEDNGFSSATLLAMGLAVGLSGLLALVWNRYSMQVILPLVIVLGVVVAGYLAYVEVNETEAVCGLVGNCNLVQQSDYAKLFGVLPIGILGLVGYGLIGASWWISQAYHYDAARQMALGLTAAGAVFSLYLTFLELFVIEAVCAWCLTSAMLMLILLWLQLPTPKLLPKRVGNR